MSQEFLHGTYSTARQRGDTCDPTRPASTHHCARPRRRPTTAPGPAPIVRAKQAPASEAASQSGPCRLFRYESRSCAARIGGAHPAAAQECASPRRPTTPPANAAHGGDGRSPPSKANSDPAPSDTGTIATTNPADAWIPPHCAHWPARTDTPPPPARPSRRGAGGHGKKMNARIH